MPIHLNINTDEVIKHTVRLERIGKNALPTAIRGALNKAAFNTKKDTLLSQSKKSFVNRDKNFFRAFSRVEMATGNNVNTMKSVVGMTEQGLKGGNNYAVKDLEQQEFGGSIGGRKLIPLVTARVGQSNQRKIAPKNTIRKINNVVSSKGLTGKNKAQRFIKAVVKAGKGGYVAGSMTTNERYIWRVTMAPRTDLRTRKTVFKAVPLYEINNTKRVRVRSTSFMEKASLQSAKNISQYYIDEAERLISKIK